MLCNHKHSAFINITFTRISTAYSRRPPSSPYKHTFNITSPPSFGASTNATNKNTLPCYHSAIPLIAPRTIPSQQTLAYPHFQFRQTHNVTTQLKRSLHIGNTVADGYDKWRLVPSRFIPNHSSTASSVPVPFSQQLYAPVWSILSNPTSPDTKYIPVNRTRGVSTLPRRGLPSSLCPVVGL